MVFADTYHQPDAVDPVLDEALVLRLVRQHIPKASAVTAVDETGGEARAYAIDDDIIVKTQRPHRVRPRTSLAKEAFFLEELARSAPEVSVPRVAGYGTTDGVEYLCMTRMPGVALARAELDAPVRRAALRSTGRVLRQIHGIDQAAFLASELFPGDTRAEDLRTRVATTLQRLVVPLGAKDDWPADLAPESLVARAVAAAPSDTPPVALHSNPGPEHVFVDPTTGAFSGLIDFGDAYRSHPAFDARTWVSAEDSRQILAGYTDDGPVAPTFLKAWLLAHLIQELGTTARGWRPSAEAAATTRRILDQLD